MFTSLEFCTGQFQAPATIKYKLRDHNNAHVRIPFMVRQITFSVRGDTNFTAKYLV